MLGVFRGRTDEHYVTGLPMKSNEAGVPALPTFAELSEHVRGVVIAGGRLYSQGMEFLGIRELLADF